MLSPRFHIALKLDSYFGKAMFQMTRHRTHLEQVGVLAPDAAYCFRYFQKRIEQRGPRRFFFPILLEEAGHSTATESGVLAPKLGRKSSGPAKEDDLTFNLRTRALMRGKSVPGDQYVISVLVAEHLHAPQLRGDDDRVDSIGHEVLDTLRPREEVDRLRQ